MILPTIMGKQDDWIRKTVRLPLELHEQLTRAAKSSSINAEIVSRLEDSFRVDERRGKSASIEDIIRALQFLDDEDQKNIIDLIVTIGSKLSRRTS